MHPSFTNFFLVGLVRVAVIPRPLLGGRGEVMWARYPGGREFDRPAARGSCGQRKTMLVTADFIEEDKALVAVTTMAGRRRTGQSHRGTTPLTVIRAAAARAGGGA